MLLARTWRRVTSVPLTSELEASAHAPRQISALKSAAPIVLIRGMYTSVRGWIEVDHKQRRAVEEIIESSRHDLYSGGWSFPSTPFNWTLYVFYGGDIPDGELPWLREQAQRIAALAPVDDDGDRPIGLFLVTDERGAADIWQVRDGALGERAAPELSWFGEESSGPRRPDPPAP